MASKRLTGIILKTARTSRGIRQGDIASDLGISQAALSHIEAGRNTASHQVLEAYAKRLVGSRDSAKLIKYLEAGATDSLPAIAELLNPNDPEGFERFVMDAAQTDRRSRREPSWSFASYEAVPLRAASMFSTRDERSSASANRDVVTVALRKFIAQRGGKTLLPGKDSSDFGMGFSLKCDLIEATRSLVIEIRSANRFESRFVAEVVGKTVLLREQGFQFVLCFTAPPTSRIDEVACETARRFGAAVIWAQTEDLDDEGQAAFGGDTII